MHFGAFIWVIPTSEMRAPSLAIVSQIIYYNGLSCPFITPRPFSLYEREKGGCSHNHHHHHNTNTKNKNNHKVKAAAARYYCAVKLFCEMNDVVAAVNWKRISRGLPRMKLAANDRAPTLQEIRKLVEYPDHRIKPIVYTM